MPLNIKNDRVSRLAQELAALTGESVTNAVGIAIEIRLCDLRRRDKSEELARELTELGRKFAIQAPADWHARNFDDELYDEKGLPR